MASRELNLATIADFLRRRYVEADAIRSQTAKLSKLEQAAVYTQPSYISNTKVTYTVPELVDVLPALSYSNIHYALIGFHQHLMKKREQPDILASLGIRVSWIKGSAKPRFEFDPELITTVNTTTVATVVEATPEGHVCPSVECTRQHFADTRFDPLIKMGGVNVGFVGGVLINESREAPVVGMYALSEVEVEILRQTFDYDYRVHDPVRE